MKFLLRISLVVLLAGICGAALIFWNLDRIVEAAANRYLTARSGEIAIRSVDLGYATAEVEVASYREPGVEVDDVTLSVSWVRYLLDGKVGDLDVSARSVVLDTERLLPAGESAALDPSLVHDELPELLTDWIDPVKHYAGRLPEGRYVLAVERLTIVPESGLAALRLEAEVESSGSEHVAANVKLGEETLDFRASLELLDGGARAALDFGLLVKDRPATLERLRSIGLERLSEAGLELYIYPLEDSEALGSLAGYLRWDEAAQVKMRGAVLANGGPADLYYGTSDAVFGSASAGLALETGMPPRGFLNLPVESLNLNGWVIDAGRIRLALEKGELGLTLDGQTARQVEIRAGDAFALVEGDGRLQGTLTLPSVDAGLLAAIDPAGFVGWSTDGTASAEVSLELEDWALRDLQGKADLRLESASAPQGLEAAGLSLNVRVSEWTGEVPVGDLAATADALTLPGVVLGDFRLEAQSDGSGSVRLTDLEASVFGGRASVADLSIDPNSVSEIDAFRLRMDSLNLESVAAAVPQFDGEIEGLVSGELRLRWNRGMILDGGELSLDSDQAEVNPRLSYQVDGLFTRGMSKDHPSYRQYRMAELALADLGLRRLSIVFFPPEQQSRLLQVRLFGESEQAEVTVPIDFTLNVNAEQTKRLLQLLRIIRDGDLEISF